MSINNDFHESPKIRSAGSLPSRSLKVYPQLRLIDPAAHAMTDFRCHLPASISPERSIDEALADMMRFGVRCLFVMSDADVVGLITSYDIEGNKPMQFLLQSRLTRREGVRVVDIMTGWDDVPTVDWKTIQEARVRDVIEIFEGVGVMHLVVVESQGTDSNPVVRGLISRTTILGRLGEASPVRTVS